MPCSMRPAARAHSRSPGAITLAPFRAFDPRKSFKYRSIPARTTSPIAKALGSITITKAPIPRGVVKSGPAIGAISGLNFIPVNTAEKISAKPPSAAPLKPKSAPPIGVSISAIFGSTVSMPCGSDATPCGKSCCNDWCN